MVFEAWSKVTAITEAGALNSRSRAFLWIFQANEGTTWTDLKRSTRWCDQEKNLVANGEGLS